MSNGELGSAAANALAVLKELAYPVAGDTPQECYTLHFDSKPPVHVVARRGSDDIQIMTEAGHIGMHPSVTLLQSLLELNAPDTVHADTFVTLHRSSGTLVVWLRTRSLDAAGLNGLLDAVGSKAERVRLLLGSQPSQNGLAGVMRGATIRLLRQLASVTH